MEEEKTTTTPSHTTWTWRRSARRARRPATASPCGKDMHSLSKQKETTPASGDDPQKPLSVTRDDPPRSKDLEYDVGTDDNEPRSPGALPTTTTPRPSLGGVQQRGHHFRWPSWRRGAGPRREARGGPRRSRATTTTTTTIECRVARRRGRLQMPVAARPEATMMAMKESIHRMSVKSSMTAETRTPAERSAPASEQAPSFWSECDLTERPTWILAAPSSTKTTTEGEYMAMSSTRSRSPSWSTMSLTASPATTPPSTTNMIEMPASARCSRDSTACFDSYCDAPAKRQSTRSEPRKSTVFSSE
mmetsp:Transcript_13381/g.53683  ORF Transcript_13381/g.53683 Transcript_13381/m.53683 type:complete len:304 (+) Transcript_13381:286-1197(+)